MKHNTFARRMLKPLALLLTLCLAFSVLVACSGKGGSGDSEKAGFAVVVDETSIKADMDIQAAIEVLGSMYDYSESSACPPFTGTEKLYDFPALQVTTYEDNGTDRIMSIFLKDDSTNVSGVKIGSTLDEMTAALGKKYKESSGTYTYTAENGSLLKCIVRDGKVVSIRITTEKADA